MMVGRKASRLFLKFKVLWIRNKLSVYIKLMHKIYCIVKIQTKMNCVIAAHFIHSHVNLYIFEGT